MASVGDEDDFQKSPKKISKLFGPIFNDSQRAKRIFGKSGTTLLVSLWLFQESLWGFVQLPRMHKCVDHIGDKSSASSWPIWPSLADVNVSLLADFVRYPVVEMDWFDTHSTEAREHQRREGAVFHVEDSFSVLSLLLRLIALMCCFQSLVSVALG